MTSGPSVLIVGAGPTGLALALWLTRRGVAVRIIDRTAEPGTTSRALAVQARTLELYRQLGIGDRLVQGGVSIAGLNLWVKGRRAARVPLGAIGEGRTPFPFVLIFPQDAHERLLIEELEKHGVKVERSAELTALEQDEERVRATLTRPDGSREICEALYLAGCDGASSTVRQQLGVGFPGGTYAGTYYVADVEATGEAVDDELHIDLEDTDFLLAFPLKPKGRLRLVGIVLGHDADGDGRLTFDEVHGSGLEHIGLTVSSVNWFSTYRVHHRVANSFRAGRAFLLGDAAHIHSPVGGQGLNTGIGDAVNLAWKLAAVVQGGAAAALLDTYQPERIAFARRLVATTDRAFTLVTRQGAIARVVRTKIAPRVGPLLFRLGPMRDLLFRTVSQVGVNYRGSTLSEGATDDLRGGDRLPWIQMADGADNFGPLASLDWQVHVYGEVRGGLPETCAELGLPLHAFPWDENMARAGVERGALYLIRPDGHIALADIEADSSTLRKYLLKRRINLRPEPATAAGEWRSRARRGAADTLVLALIVAAVAGAAWLLRDPAPIILDRRGSLTAAHEASLELADSHYVQVVRLKSSSGLTVSMTTKRHVADAGARLPLALLLGGRNTGQDAVRLLENTRGVMAVALSYPYAGDPKPKGTGVIRAIPQIRQAFFDTPAALMLALDDLLARPDVNSDQVEAIGVSLGVPFVVIASALDPRVTRVWALHGSGGTFTPLEHSLREIIPSAPVRFGAAAIGTLAMSGPRITPERWVGRISPRPFIMINAANDERLPKHAVLSLFAAAKEPKELIWLPGAHVTSDADALRPLVEMVMSRIAGD